MTPFASILTDFWNDQILADQKQGLFLVLVGFVLSFAFIRMSTRLMRSPRVPWWPGSVVSESGVHLHHLVFGIVTMMISGTLGFAALGESPWAEICAFFFGVGAGLTIDEFALWVYLDDVYWAEEGRSSIDATVIAAAAMGLVLLGFTPFASTPARSKDRRQHPRPGVFLARLRSPSPRAGDARDRRFLPFPDRALRGCRIGKPDSAWARRRYGDRRPDKQAKSEGRFPPDRHTERFKNAFRDIVGGKPSEGLTAVKDEALAATREATAEMRQRAEQVSRPRGRPTTTPSGRLRASAADTRSRSRGRVSGARVSRRPACPVGEVGVNVLGVRSVEGLLSSRFTAPGLERLLSSHSTRSGSSEWDLPTARIKIPTGTWEWAGSAVVLPAGELCRGLLISSLAVGPN